MPIATNAQGEAVYLNGAGQWVPAPTAQNDQGERVAYDGQAWKPVGPRKPMAMADVGLSAIKNTPSSAVEFGKNLVEPFIHPVETATAMKNIGEGVLQKFGVVSGEDKEKYADAVGKFFMDRYGGVENIKHTLATDPVGALADVATVLTGGELALGRAPGIVGETARAVGTVGRTVDPLNVAAKAVTATGKAASQVVGGLTGVGPKSLQLAAEAGAEGGAKGKTFLENLSGASAEEAVSDARAAVAKLKEDRGKVYRQEMQKVGANQTVLSFNDIDAAMNAIDAVKTYKGQELSPKTQAIRDELNQAVNDWRALPPKDFHTPEGLDALKQKIGDIRDATEYGSPPRLVADKVYNAIKDTITQQVPEYAKIMKGYEEATSLVKEIERTLTGKPGASIDTALRKLQSILRNNVNTNYGNRAALADFLVSAGAPNLLTKLAGQSLNTWTPRGLGHVTNAMELMTALHELAQGNPKAAAMVGGLLPLSSPKLMGGAAYSIGAASRLPLRAAGRAAFQSGRQQQQR